MRRSDRSVPVWRIAGLRPPGTGLAGIQVVRVHRADTGEHRIRVDANVPAVRRHNRAGSERRPLRKPRNNWKVANSIEATPCQLVREHLPQRLRTKLLQLGLLQPLLPIVLRQLLRQDSVRQGIYLPGRQLVDARLQHIDLVAVSKTHPQLFSQPPPLLCRSSQIRFRDDSIPCRRCWTCVFRPATSSCGRERSKAKDHVRENLAFHRSISASCRRRVEQSSNASIISNCRACGYPDPEIRH